MKCNVNLKFFSNILTRKPANFFQTKVQYVTILFFS